MTRRERWRGLLRAMGQASAYFVFVLMLVEFMRRERVVTMGMVLTPRTLVVVGVLWAVVAVYYVVREEEL